MESVLKIFICLGGAVIITGIEFVGLVRTLSQNAPDRNSQLFFCAADMMGVWIAIIGMLLLSHSPADPFESGRRCGLYPDEAPGMAVSAGAVSDRHKAGEPYSYSVYREEDAGCPVNWHSSHY